MIPLRSIQTKCLGLTSPKHLRRRNKIKTYFIDTVFLSLLCFPFLVFFFIQWHTQYNIQDTIYKRYSIKFHHCIIIFYLYVTYFLTSLKANRSFTSVCPRTLDQYEDYQVFLSPSETSERCASHTKFVRAKLEHSLWGYDLMLIMMLIFMPRNNINSFKIEKFAKAWILFEIVFEKTCQQILQLNVCSILKTD